MSNITTSIHIEAMRIHAFHGVMEQERVVGNDYLIDVSIDYPWTKAAETDRVEDTMSYADLADIIRDVMSVPSSLLENVAKRMADAITAAFPQTTAIHIKITKLAPPMRCDCRGAGVELHITNS